MKPAKTHPPKIKALDPIHRVARVRDAMAWYCEVFGFEVEYAFEHEVSADYGIIERDGHRIHFVQSAPRTEGEIRGWLSIDVNDVDVLFEHLEAHSGLPEGFPRRLPSCQEHAPRDAEYGRRDAFLLDPFGFVLHIGQDL